METKKQSVIVVEYYSDPTKMVDDHDSEPIYLTEINERRFINMFDAVKFLSECREPITTPKDLIAMKIPRGFKLVLPEHNIKIKHQANNTLDSIFDLDAIDWG